MASEQQVRYLTEALQRCKAVLQPHEPDTHMPTCYLCLDKIDDSPLQLTVGSDLAREVFSLDIICAHALLSVAGFENNTSVTCPLTYDQHKTNKYHYKKKPYFRMANNVYEAKKKEKPSNISFLPDYISRSLR